MFGGIYPGQEGDYAKFLKVEARSLAIGSREFWAQQCAVDPFASAINLTAYGVSVRSVTGGSMADAAYDLFVIDTLDSLVHYWNSRAVREASLFDDRLG